ncbi:MAG TPA: hypothetical protein ENI76_10925 [Ignavibacteria bacterium]|nr:hypothetical protein [Ignavibacteria bacterium]
MPKFDHSNFGEVADTTYHKGVLSSVDEENDTCNVAITLPGYLGGGEIVGIDVPIFYHCEPNVVKRSNGALEGASQAFSFIPSLANPADEPVIVMVKGNKIQAVVGIVSGKVPCCGGTMEYLFDFLNIVAGDPFTLTNPFSHSYSESPEVPTVLNIPASMASPPSSDDINASYSNGVIDGFDIGCLKVAIGTSKDGLSGALDSFDPLNEADYLYNAPSDEIGYGFTFQQFWDDTVVASCPWATAPHCGDITYPIITAITGDTAFICGGVPIQFGVTIDVGTTGISGHIATLRDCVVYGCDQEDWSASIVWSLVGVGWSMDGFGMVTPPACGCVTCPDATLTATMPPWAGGSTLSTTLTASGCGGVLTISGPTVTTCTGTYQYTSSLAGVTWSVVGGGTINSAGLFTPPSTNVDCVNNSIITADWVCPTDPTITQSANMSVANNCYTGGATAYAIYCCDPLVSGGNCLDAWKEYGQFSNGNCTYVINTWSGYKCDGTWNGNSSGGCPSCLTAIGSPPNVGNPAPCGDIVMSPACDKRTTAMKTGGCCPESLL